MAAPSNLRSHRRPITRPLRNGPHPQLYRDVRNIHPHQKILLNSSHSIFPTPSIPILNSASTLGLVFLMFLVGLEMDISGLRENLKPALAVAFLGMALPFGLGCALAVGLYGHFQKAEEGGGRFGVYALFIGLALAITAFPILARILMVRFPQLTYTLPLWSLMKKLSLTEKM